LGIPLFLFAFFVIFAFSLLNGIALLRRLRLSHPKVWEILGCPSMMGSNFVKSHWTLVRFVWTLRFTNEADPILTLYCLAAMFMEVLLAVCFIALVLGAV
jgi:hypothetical protein